MLLRMLGILAIWSDMVALEEDEDKTSSRALGNETWEFHNENVM